MLFEKIEDLIFLIHGAILAETLDKTKQNLAQ